MVSFDAIKTALNGFRSWIDKRLDTLNTVKVDRSELMQSDFLQNDHTQLDYIKNKPFQDSREKTVVLEEQSFILTEYNGECYWDSAALTSSLIEGNLYEVSINGFSYTTRCYRNADNAHRLGILRLDCPKEIYLVACIDQMDETNAYIRILGSYNVNVTISIKEVEEESYNDKYKVVRMNPDLLPISNTRELSDNCTPVLAKGGILYVDRDLPNVWPNDVGSFARVSSDGKWVAESIDVALKSDIPEGFSGSWNDLVDTPFSDIRTRTVIVPEQEIVFVEYNGRQYNAVISVGEGSPTDVFICTDGELYEIQIGDIRYFSRCSFVSEYVFQLEGNEAAGISVIEGRRSSLTLTQQPWGTKLMFALRHVDDKSKIVLSIDDNGEWVTEEVDLALKSDIPNNSESVLYTAQELNLDQQAQARENIGAADLDSLIEVFEDIDELRANTGGKTVIGVIDSHYYNFRFLNEERGATMAEIREAAQSKDKDIVIRLDLDNWQGTLQYLGLVNLTDDGSTYKQALLFSTIKMNNGVINTSDNIVSGTVQLEYWYTLLDPGDDMPPVAFVNCQFAEINLAPGASHAGSFMRVNEDGLWDVEEVDVALKSDIPDAVINPTTASVGQAIVVKTVDENNKPTEWEAVDMSNGGDTPVKGVDYFTETDKQEIVGMVLDDIESSAQIPTLTDTITGQKYRLSVENGKLTMTEVTE